MRTVSLPSFELLLLISFAPQVPAFSQTRPAAPEPSSVTVLAPGKNGGDNYAGAERCRTCHRPEYLQYEKTVHARLKPGRNDAVTGCEMCHGPGKAHADNQEAAGDDEAKLQAGRKLIFSFRGNPKQNAERCMSCHQTSRDQRMFHQSTHAQHGVSCGDCHATHLVVSRLNPQRTALRSAPSEYFNVPTLAEENRWLRGSLLKRAQPELCYECHGNIQAAFALPTHHRVPEGAMKCTDCHNAHGTSNRATLRQSGWETCANCHIEKRGPFVFEHSAVKVEGCTACHTPHGSVNRNLLTRREERFLCLQCHVDPFAANVPHSRLGFQARGDCVRCHSSIHGSNFNEFFLH